MRSILRRRRLGALIAATVAVLVVGWLNVLSDFPADSDLATPAVLTGVVLAMAVPGLVAEWRRPRDRMAWVMVAVGVATAAAAFRLLQSGTVATFGAAMFFASPLWVCHLVLAYPHGLLSPRLRLAVAAGWSLPAGLAVPMLLLSGPSGEALGAEPGGRRASSWAFVSEVGDTTVWLRQDNPLFVGRLDSMLLATWILWSTVVVAGALATLVVLHGRSVPPIELRLTRMLSAVAALNAALSPVIVLLGFPEPLDSVSGSVLHGRGYADLALIAPAITVAMLSGVTTWSELVQPRLRRSVGGSIAIETLTQELDALVQRSLGDPSARLLFADDHGDWVDGTGASSSPDWNRAGAVVTRSGRPVALVEHDDWLLHQPDLVNMVIASVSLPIESRRLAALSLAAAHDAVRSAGVLVTAADRTRAVLRDAIEAGPIATLDDVIQTLDNRAVSLDRVQRGLHVALAQLREIAHDMAPLTTSERDAGAMICAAADSSEHAIVLLGVPTEPLPTAITATLVLIVRHVAQHCASTVEISFDLTDVAGLAPVVTVRLDGAVGRFAAPLMERIVTLGGSVDEYETTSSIQLPLMS